MKLHKTQAGSLFALLAAAFFGASTPFAKVLLEKISPIMLSGLLYGGSAIGLGIIIILRKFLLAHKAKFQLRQGDFKYLVISIFFGGVMAPTFLMFGLSLIPAHNASILLNSEVILTALLAWIVFKEKFDWHIMIGIIFAIIANIVISSEEAQFNNMPWGSIFVVMSCLCWALDNNITRKIADNDVLILSFARGSIAGIFNITLAFILGYKFPTSNLIIDSVIVGFIGYGMCLICFISALRNIGAAKAGAYFSLSPFCAAAFSLIILHEPTTTKFYISTILTLISVIILSYKELRHSIK